MQSELTEAILRLSDREESFLVEASRLDPMLHTLQFPVTNNGSANGVYHGTVRYQHKQGWGVQVWDNGPFYRGQWHKHRPHGYGVCVWPQENDLCGFHRVYEGEWADGMRDGQGTQKWVSKKKKTESFQEEIEAMMNEEMVTYKGGWVKDLPGGHGLLTFPDGCSHEGEFFEGCADGFGLRLWPKSKCRYEGEWRKGTMHGQGTMTWSDGDVVYTGSWKNGKRHGKGIMTWKGESDKVYQGEFCDDMKHGEGVCTFADGSQFRGVWVRDVRNSGVFQLPDGTHIQDASYLTQ